MSRRGLVSPLATWFAGPAAITRFRRRRLSRAPVVLPARDGAWRAIAPDFSTTIAMARAGVPFQIAAERRYDRTGDPRRLGPALAAGATVFLPQVHQVLPRLMRLMVALRAGLLGPLREECSFLFAVEGRGRPGMGLHHDGPVDAFWLQLEGRRTVTLGPPVKPGTPADLDPRQARTTGAAGARWSWRPGRSSTCRRGRRTTWSATAARWRCRSRGGLSTRAAAGPRRRRDAPDSPRGTSCPGESTRSRRRHVRGCGHRSRRSWGRAEGPDSPSSPRMETSACPRLPTQSACGSRRCPA